MLICLFWNLEAKLVESQKFRSVGNSWVEKSFIVEGSKFPVER